MWQGPAGTQGPKGATGSVEVITCLTTGAHHVRKCTGVSKSGPLKLTGTGIAARAMLRRGQTTFASGTGFTSPGGRTQLVLVARRALKAGSYTLILRRRGRGGWVTSKQSVTLG